MKKTFNTLIIGAVIFFVLIFLVPVAIYTLPLTLATPIKETTKYQDSQWLTACLPDITQVNDDMKSLTTAAKNYDFASASTYTTILYTDSHKAIEDSNLYNVSPDLQGSKDEYRSAMLQANKVAVYANSGVEAYNNRNFVSLNSNVKQATECVKSYNEHIKKAVKLSKNSKPTKNYQLAVYITELSLGRGQYGAFNLAPYP